MAPITTTIRVERSADDVFDSRDESAELEGHPAVVVIARAKVDT